MKSKKLYENILKTVKSRGYKYIELDAVISSEIYPGEGKLRKQMEYANKINSPAVILYGDNEIKTGKVTLKNLKSGKETSVAIESLSDEIKKIV